MGLTDSLGFNPLKFENDDRSKKVSLHFLEKIKLHLGDQSIKIILEEGDFADTILMKAKELGTDTLVMGSHSHRWLEDLILGSVTAKVVRLTTIPVYIVPTKKRD
jgi:nucleotide-binding universal stress UspA family protein